MSTRRYVRILLAVVLVLAPAALGVLAGANTESLAAPLGAPGDTWIITPSAGANGAIDPATAQSVLEGTDQAFTITPATGYHIDDVLVDGTSDRRPSPSRVRTRS